MLNDENNYSQRQSNVSGRINVSGSNHGCNSGGNIGGLKKVNNYFCTHRKMSGHSVDMCFKLMRILLISKVPETKELQQYHSILSPETSLRNLMLTHPLLLSNISNCWIFLISNMIVTRIKLIRIIQVSVVKAQFIKKRKT